MSSVSVPIFIKIRVCMCEWHQKYMAAEHIFLKNSPSKTVLMSKDGFEVFCGMRLRAQMSGTGKLVFGWYIDKIHSYMPVKGQLCISTSLGAMACQRFSQLILQAQYIEFTEWVGG